MGTVGMRFLSDVAKPLKRRFLRHRVTPGARLQTPLTNYVRVVTDASSAGSAGVPDAIIKITQSGYGFHKASNLSPQFPAAVTKLVFPKRAFAPSPSKGLCFRPCLCRTRIDAMLGVGTVTESVNVDASAALLRSRRSPRGNQFENAPFPRGATTRG